VGADVGFSMPQAASNNKIMPTLITKILFIFMVFSCLFVHIPYAGCGGLGVLRSG
jgi:hypothetical protein